MDQQVQRYSGTNARDVRGVAHGGEMPWRLHNAHRGHDRWVETLQQAAQERDIVLVGKGDQFLGVGEAVGERLFHQQRQALLQHLEPEVVMGLRGARNDYGLDIVHAVEVSSPRYTKLLSDSGAKRTLRVDDISELGSI